MHSVFWRTLFISTLIIAAVASARAQIEVYGVDMKATGTVDAGYSGSFGNLNDSSHGLDLGANANIDGYYYNPNFLSFSVQPFYGRSQANSAYQSLTNSSGVNAIVNLFSGSHLPGFVSASTLYNSTGQYGIPGASSILTNGNTQSFGVGWSALFPGLPTFNVTYTDANGDSSVYGLNDKSHSTQKTLTLRSHYSFADWQFDGTYRHLTTDSVYPLLATPDGQPIDQATTSVSNQLEFSAGHRLPWNGSFTATGGRFNYNSTYEESDGTPVQARGVSDSLNAVATLHPAARLTMAFDTSYNDNAIGSFIQQVVAAGGPAPSSDLGTIRTWRSDASATVTVTNNIFAGGSVSHISEYYMGNETGITVLGATVGLNYSHPLFGAFNFSAALYDNASQDGNQGLGGMANVTYARKIGRWETDGNFTYAQNVQTMLVMYTTSSYAYRAHVLRKVGDKFHWSGSYSGGHSGFMQQSDSYNSMNSFSTSIGYRHTFLSGSYSTSQGQSLMTGSGLISVPNNLPPSILSSSNLVVFNAKAYSGTIGTTLFRRISLSGAYSKGTGATGLVSQNLQNSMQVLDAQLRYQFRKISFNAGYTRFNQSFSSSTTGPSVVTTYYFGFSRWFNLF